MLQKLGKIKVGRFSLREYMQVNALGYLGQSLGKQFPINICIVVGETLVYKYTTLFGRVHNGFLHDFKLAETNSKFRKIL